MIFAQMVDVPPTYVDTLLSDPTTKHAATRELERRMTIAGRLSSGQFSFRCRSTACDIGQLIGQIITEQGADLIAIHFRQSFGRIIATLAMARMGSFAVDFISSCAMVQLEEKRRCPVKMS